MRDFTWTFIQGSSGFSNAGFHLDLHSMVIRIQPRGNYHRGDAEDTMGQSSLALLIYTSRQARGMEDADMAEGLLKHGYAPACIQRIAYDDADLIAHSLQDALSFYENTVIVCPEVMEDMLKSYIEQNFSKKFEDFCLNSGSRSVYIVCRGKQGTPAQGMPAQGMPSQGMTAQGAPAQGALTAERICSMLDAKYGVDDIVAYLRCAGVPDEVLKQTVEEANRICPEVRFNITGLHGDCRIQIVRPASLDAAVYGELYRTILSRLNDYIYAMEDTELNEMVVQLLKLRKMTISVAESFTGGGICKKLVEIPGVSAVFDEGINTYSNRSKMQRLGVDLATLNRYGAVSRETAAEMCMGLIKNGACNVAVSTTGIAGPSSDNTAKPVGLLYIGVGTEDRIDVFEYNLKGSREDITATAINLALLHVYKTIK